MSAGQPALDRGQAARVRGDTQDAAAPIPSLSTVRSAARPALSTEQTTVMNGPAPHP